MKTWMEVIIRPSTIIAQGEGMQPLKKRKHKNVLSKPSELK